MKRVMVVDDDESLLRTVGLVLTRSGLEPVLVPSGEQCLDLVRGGFKGVILMDIMMPGLTGWETIRALGQEQLLQNVLICMLTAKWSPGQEGQGLEEYVFDYLPKPFDHTALLNCVQTALSFVEE